MPTNRTGKFISGGNPQSLGLTDLGTNNGVFDLRDESIAVGNNTWQPSASGYYEIARSVRLKRSVSSFFSRTPSTSGNRKTWTYSGWHKFSINGSGGNNPIFFAGLWNTRPTLDFNLVGDSYFVLNVYNGSSYDTYIKWNNILKDPTAWYHIVLSVDTTQTNPNDRVRLFVNGVQQSIDTASSPSLTYPSQNFEYQVNQSSITHTLGYFNYSSQTSYDGYRAEEYLTDGYRLEPTSFGYFDPVSNIWQPKPYTGGYGTNGFYLNYSDNSQATYTSNVGIGKDFSGNGNYFTSNYVNVYGTVVSFTSTGTTSWTAPAGVTSVQYLVVAGGGGGGSGGGGSGAGGGGAGGYLSGTLAVTPSTSYTVTVGSGGGTSTNGGNSVFSSITAIGGGAGGSASGGSGATGGSGGGGAAVAGSGGAGTSGQGYRGGNVSNLNQGDNGGAGGGGAASQGGDHGWSNTGTGGGNGIQNGITGTYVTYARGGDGGVGSYWSASYPRSTFAANTGGGGGGGNATTYGPTSGASGIVVLSYGSSSTSSSTANDSMTDSPTNVFTTATDTGGVVSGNYATWNSLNKSSNVVLTEAAFKTAGNGGVNDWMPVYATIAAATGGKWYWEYTMYPNTNAVQGFCKMVGIVPPTATPTNGNYIGSSGYGYGLWVPDGSGGNAFVKRYNGTNTTLGANYALTNGDVIQVAYNASTGQIWFGKNNTWFEGNPSAGTGASYSSIDTSVQWLPALNEWYNSAGMTGNYTQTNFGQLPFKYTPPTGFKSLNTTNLQALGTSSVATSAAAPKRWFDIVQDRGTTVPRRISGLKFQPDLVIFKNLERAGNARWSWFDSVRGPNASLSSQVADTEVTSQTDLLTSFTSDGFTVGADAGLYGTNGYNERMCHWVWKQSPSAGLNIVSWTGNGAANRAVTHNLGVAPAFIIAKGRDIAYNWDIYHKSLGISATLTMATANGTRNANAFGTIAPDSSNFYTYDQYTNTSGYKYIAYVWAEVPGFSKFGSYTANNSTNGPFLYCGFKPKVVFIRSTTGAREWNVYDTSRTISSGFGNQLDFGQNHAEYTTSGYNDVIQFVSNGIKIKSNASPNYNANSETYVYAAFAESPFALNNRAG